MTMLIELDRNNRTSLRRLFDRYPYLRGSVAAVIEGGMRGSLRMYKRSPVPSRYSIFRPTVGFVAVGWPVLSRQP
jgi:hypothetical protein